MSSLSRSVTPATPATPAGQTAAKATPTGTWRHPKFDEITRRQHARTFSEQNAKAILVNALYFFSTFIVPSFASGWIVLYVHYFALLAVRILTADSSPIFRLTKSMSPYDFYFMLALRAVLLYSIGVQFWPLFKPKDDLVDI